MAKKAKVKNKVQSSIEIGNGGELHMVTGDRDAALTSNQGLPIGDNQNSLRVAPAGPLLLEDFVLREKITHFDHERIPERVVHARGYAAHGYFQCYRTFEDKTCARFLCDPNIKTPVFVRFSTVAGSAGSSDTVRDARGFAVKFYTEQGNFDLVGNNIPVFFIQDTMKFPDLVHSVKPEPDRGFPQAQSAHDTFWDYIACTPESIHMVMWMMSDWAIPRSFRMMPGFGVHTFHFVTEDGQTQMVKFHWRPKLGSFALVWDEAVRISGADPDYHRRDLWNAIEDGHFPAWELSVQLISPDQVESLGVDVLDPTKLIPEEQIPLTPLGVMVLDRNVDNFFAETEQVAFCPANLVPGIDFSNDPLLQGRLFSYLDTQLSRLGNSNFHQLPVNSPRCPMRNFMRDGQMQMHVPTGRISYEPSLLEPTGLHEHKHGFHTVRPSVHGAKERTRPSTFRDHFSQAEQFFRSQTKAEQAHIEDAFVFELGKCKDAGVRLRVLELLVNVNDGMAERISERLGLTLSNSRETKPHRPDESAANVSLSLLANTPLSIAGKKIGLLLTDGFDDDWLESVSFRVHGEHATLAIVGPSPATVYSNDEGGVTPDDFLDGAPSCLFDSLIVAAQPDDLAKHGKLETAIDWIRTGYRHFKVIGYLAGCEALLVQAGVDLSDAGVINSNIDNVESFIKAAKQHRNWKRKVL